MKNYETILTELGLEIPSDKKDLAKKLFGENYRTINDYNNVVAKRDEMKTSLDEVQKKLEGFAGIDVDDMKNQITSLTNQLNSEKEDRKKEALTKEREKVIEEFLSGKKFVNEFTENHIRSSIMSELERGTGASVEKIFDGLTMKDGKRITNILAETENTPSFATGMHRGQNTKKMTREEIGAIKSDSARRKAIAENLDLYGYKQ